MSHAEALDIMLIGLGKIGAGDGVKYPEKFVLNHYEAMKKVRRFRITALVDSDIRKRDKLDLEDRQNFFLDLDSVSVRDSVKLVIVAVPTSMTEYVAERVVSVFKPKVLLLEKPLGYCPSNWENFSKIVGEKGIAVHVNYHRRADPGFQQLKNMIMREEEKGKFRVVARYTGAFFNMASHFFDLFQWYFGSLITFSSARVLGGGKDLEQARIGCRLEYQRANVELVPLVDTSRSIFEMKIDSKKKSFLIKPDFQGIYWKHQRVSWLDRTRDVYPHCLTNAMMRAQLNVAEDLESLLVGGRTSLPTLNQGIQTLSDLRNVYNSSL